MLNGCCSAIVLANKSNKIRLKPYIETILGTYTLKKTIIEGTVSDSFLSSGRACAKWGVPLVEITACSNACQIGAVQT